MTLSAARLGFREGPPGRAHAHETTKPWSNSPWSRPFALQHFARHLGRPHPAIDKLLNATYTRPRRGCTYRRVRRGQSHFHHLRGPWSDHDVVVQPGGNRTGPTRQAWCPRSAASEHRLGQTAVCVAVWRPGQRAPGM